MKGAISSEDSLISPLCGLSLAQALDCDQLGLGRPVMLALSKNLSAVPICSVLARLEGAALFVADLLGQDYYYMASSTTSQLNARSGAGGLAGRVQ